MTPPTPPGSIDPQRWLTWIEMAGTIIVLILLANLTRSRFGRSFRAVPDDEIAASLSGIHVARTKVLAFTVAASCAGLAGAFLGLSIGVVNTGEFSLTLSIYLLAGMVLGGAGSLVGAWWGAIVIVFMPGWSNSIANSFNLGKLRGRQPFPGHLRPGPDRGDHGGSHGYPRGDQLAGRAGTFAGSRDGTAPRIPGASRYRHNPRHHDRRWMRSRIGTVRRPVRP